MATYAKGTIGYIPVVDQINRKFALRKTTCSSKEAGPVKLAPNKFMGGATRVLHRAGLGLISKNIMFFRENPRAKVYSTAERLNQLIFKTAMAGANFILQDLSQMTRVQQMYAEAEADNSKAVNGVHAKGYGYAGWVKAVQYAGRKENDSYDVNTFPQSFDA